MAPKSLRVRPAGYENAIKTGSKRRVFVARGITWRSFEFFHFWSGYGF